MGIQLGIPRHVLKQFEKEDDPLSAVVDYWLEGNVMKPATPVSWKSVVAALEAESVEEKALAESISKKIASNRIAKLKKVDASQNMCRKYPELGEGTTIIIENCLLIAIDLHVK